VLHVLLLAETLPLLLNNLRRRRLLHFLLEFTLSLLLGFFSLLDRVFLVFQILLLLLSPVSSAGQNILRFFSKNGTATSILA
jgi:VanZ family protein